MPTNQLDLIPQKANHRFFGGALLNGRRKSTRPLARNEAMHFVMRSPYAFQKTSLRQVGNLKEIEKILTKSARKYGVKIYRQAIQSNHIHLIIRITNRKLYRAFISVITGKIASQVMKGMSFQNFLKTLDYEKHKRGEGAPNISGKGQAFWQFRPFHRILKWGRDYAGGCRYLLKNSLEAVGFIPHEKREKNESYAAILKQQNKPGPIRQL
jgi:REP element-mobilizing transposase RayT